MTEAHQLDHVDSGPPGRRPRPQKPDEEPVEDPIEANKRRAMRGWIADPPPPREDPVPEHHRGKWRTMMVRPRER